METFEDLSKTLETKMKMLRFTQDDAPDTLEKNHLPSMERLCNVLKTKGDEVHALIVRLTEARIERGEEPADIRKSKQTIEANLEDIEQTINKLDEKIKQAKQREMRNSKEEEEYLVRQTRKQRYEEEMRFEEEKLQQKLKYEQKIIEGRTNQEQKGNLKLPKLVITKFKGTHTDWLRFWNQFETEIDKTDIPQVTKFSYLKEHLEPKIRTSIDGLPFTTEGYERAKNILKLKFGKTSEIVNAYVNNIISLPSIHGTNATKIYEFYEKLLNSVQSLETLGKLKEVNGYVRNTLDKLDGIRGDLVRTDEDWHEWKFPELIEALRKWTERNPPKIDEKIEEKVPKERLKHGRSFQTKQQDWKIRPCVYCESRNHKSVNCDKITKPEERKKVLSVKQLCFNCTGPQHRAADCRSKSDCQLCQKRHHTSLCDQKPEQMLIATGKGSVTYPVVIVEAEGIKCRALLDTGAGSSYASEALLDRLNKRPQRKEYKRIEMMMETADRMIEVYDLTIKNIEGKFKLNTEVTKVNRSKLLSLKNPGYGGLIAEFPHLKGVKMGDVDDKKELPVHLILGASEYAKIKTETKPKVGKPGEPIAELTRFGWTIISPGKEVDLTNMFLTQTSTADYERLCRLDVLGLEDSTTGDQQSVYSEFQEQLVRHPLGWYETGLPWKGNHPKLATNEQGSLRRLQGLVKKLEKQPDMLKRYDDVIKDQLDQGIVEKVGVNTNAMKFYIPHKPVVRETAESTKLRIVYDASARASEKSPSLNDCLETGPPLQNRLWNVLVRNRFYPVAITGDLKQAFLQVRIRKEDRDVMRFHWLKDVTTKEVETLRFTRALFGLAPSPFLLGGVIEQHLQNCKPKFPEEVKEIKRSLYVDDLIGGGETVEKAQHLKESAQVIFNEAHFELHKWHSNIASLEVENTSVSDQDQTYAKEQLGVKQGETKLLGMTWNKTEDTLEVKFPAQPTEKTKRGVLSKIAKIYDPLGLVSPVTLTGKTIYREICDIGIAWDKQLPSNLATKWNRWEQSLPSDVKTPRSIARFQEKIDAIDLHAFGDASAKGVSTAVYAVVHQPSGTTQGLVAAKSRLSKKGLTIPRLELVSGHMSANLLHNVKGASEDLPVRNSYCWLDSTVALYWIRDRGDYKQFVRNRVRKIQERNYIQWRHVPTEYNPADLGSRGGKVGDSNKLWWNGPSWLSVPEDWPPNIAVTATAETESEAAVVKEVLGVAEQQQDELGEIIQKWDYWKSIRISAWMARFIHNSRAGKRSERTKGPLTTEEIEEQTLFWIKRVQAQHQESSEFRKDQLQLNLQKNNRGVYECRGRLQGDYPAYLPDKALFSEKLVMNAHVRTLHGGVGLTMTAVRREYWIPRLRTLAKRTIKKCNGCKRFHATAFAQPPTGNLPRDRTEGSTPFQVVGVDYAGPILVRTKKGQEKKSYILLYTCSLSRALHLELLPDLTADEFIQSLKRFIARRGRPEKIYSDNGATFLAAAKWLRKVQKDERFHDWLAKHKIVWQFNLARAPWWGGGQFERLVGLVKQALHKSIGKAHLTWNELQDILLDVENTLNNRPLSYVEDDIQMPVLTPNALMFGRPTLIPEQNPDSLDDVNLRKRARYLQRCKNALWSRWSSEYLKGLRERHNLKHQEKENIVEPGDIVLIKGDERNRGHWKIGIVEQLIKGRDGIVRAVRLRAGKSHLERAIQQLYPMEFSCDRTTEKETLNVQAREFVPKRRAATIANEKIRIIANEDSEKMN